MKFSSSLTRRMVAVGIGALTAVCLSSPAWADAKIVLKLGHLANEDNVWHKACLKFAEEVGKRTNGQIEVKVFPNEQLGKETDLIKGIQLGTVDFTITGESLQNWVPEAALLAVPYAIRDIEHLDRVVQGPIGAKIAKAIEDKTQLKPLGYFARGSRELSSNRPIKSPDDLNGLKLRVPNVPLFVSFWSALGAKPVPMAFSEVFTSLQSNAIEAQENPYSLTLSGSFYEVQKYENMTDHVISWIYLVGGSKKLAKLTPDQQKAIAEAAKAAQAYERGLFIQDEKQNVEALKAKGVTFVEVDKKAFMAKGQPAVAAALPAEIKPLYEEILATK